MHDQTAEFLALLNVAFDPEPGRRYPTIDQYAEALDQIRRDAARRARPPTPAPPPPAAPSDLIARVLATPQPAREVALEAQVLRRGRLEPPQPVVQPPHGPGLQLYIRTIGGPWVPGPLVPVSGQRYPLDRRDLAEGALALFRARQPGVDFVIIAE